MRRCGACARLPLLHRVKELAVRSKCAPLWPRVTGGEKRPSPASPPPCVEGAVRAPKSLKRVHQNDDQTPAFARPPVCLFFLSTFGDTATSWQSTSASSLRAAGRCNANASPWAGVRAHLSTNIILQRRCREAQWFGAKGTRCFPPSTCRRETPARNPARRRFNLTGFLCCGQRCPPS